MIEDSTAQGPPKLSYYHKGPHVFSSNRIGTPSFPRETVSGSSNSAQTTHRDNCFDLSYRRSGVATTFQFIFISKVSSPGYRVSSCFQSQRHDNTFLLTTTVLDASRSKVSDTVGKINIEWLGRSRTYPPSRRGMFPVLCVNQETRRQRGWLNSVRTDQIKEQYAINSLGDLCERGRV